MCHFCYLGKIPCNRCFTTYTKTQQKTNNNNNNKKQKSRGWRGGFIERVIEVNTFCRLGLFFAAGAKARDIIKKQVHTRRFSFWLWFWTVQSTITWPVSSRCQVTCYITGTINVPEHNFWIALARGCLLWRQLYFISYICPGICWLVPVETNTLVSLSSYADAPPLPSWKIQSVSSRNCNCSEKYSKAIRVSLNQGTAKEMLSTFISQRKY